MVQDGVDERLKDLVLRLVRGPEATQNPFLASGMRYAELYALAAHIRKDLGHQKVVCLCTHDKAIVAAAILSALAGGPRLILPYALSSGVISELQSLTGFSHAITDGETPLPSEIEAFIPVIDAIGWLPEASRSPVGMETPVIHLFTGGSTGTPKSWPKSVRNLLAESMRIAEEYSISADDCLVSTVSPLHIYGLLYSILAPLVAAASVTNRTPMFPAEIEKEIRENQATVFISVPAHYRALREHEGPALSLRLAFSSAGMLSATDALAFSKKNNVGIIEVYGSTETGGVGSRERYAGESDFRPFSSVEVKLVEGDLWVKSHCLSPGLPQDAQGFYKIGDRAVFSDQHRFTLVGRSDAVIKVGGKRVDLDAVREVLLSHGQVREALVTALSVGRAREHMIVAVIEGRPDPADLTRLLSDSLEPYARPRRIKMVDQLPITAAGKWDRRTIEALFSELSLK